MQTGYTDIESNVDLEINLYLRSPRDFSNFVRGCSLPSMKRGVHKWTWESDFHQMGFLLNGL